MDGFFSSDYKKCYCLEDLYFNHYDTRPTAARCESCIRNKWRQALSGGWPNEKTPLLPAGDATPRITAMANSGKANTNGTNGANGLAEKAGQEWTGGTFDGLPWGLWQVRALLLAGICKIPTAWHMASVLFTAPALPQGTFRCAHRLDAPTPPETTDGVAALGPWDWSWQLRDACGEALSGNSTLAADSVHSVGAGHAASMCSEWEYVGPEDAGARAALEHDYRSVVTQWALVCERGVLVSVTQFCYLFGILVGGAICMKLLPRVGPRRLLLMGLLLEALLGFLLAFSPLLPLHMVLRALLAASCAHVFTAGASLCADMCIGRAKGLTSSLFEIWWSLGVISLAVVGAQFDNWNRLQLALSLPAVLLLAPCVWLLPESPRWLVSRGRVEEAAALYEKGAELSRQKHLLPPQHALLLQLQQQANTARNDKMAQQSVWSVELVRERAGLLARLLVLHVAWAGVVPSFYGGLLNVRNLGAEPGMGGVARNTATAGLAEIVGFAIGAWLSLRASKPLLWLGLLLVAGGSACVMSHLVHPEDAIRDVSLLLLAMAGRVSVAAALPTLASCSGRLVPASQRASLIFSCVVFARLWLLGAPFVGNLAFLGEPFPLTVFGGLTTLAGLCSLLLETLGPYTPSSEKTSMPKQGSTV